jgi:Cu/Ag efflux pump CusA
MSWLVRTSLQFRVIVIMVALGLSVIGVRTTDSIPLDVFPEFAPPLAEIQTEAPGISTEDLESLISVPMKTQSMGFSLLCRPLVVV